MPHAMAGTPASACITPNRRCPAVADARHDPAHGNRHGFVPAAGADGVLAPMPSRWSDTRVGIGGITTHRGLAWVGNMFPAPVAVVLPRESPAQGDENETCKNPDENRNHRIFGAIVTICPLLDVSAARGS
jgi:hypothetical protein